MQSNSFFIIPLTIAYLSICAMWFVISAFGLSWPISVIKTPHKPWLEMGLALVTCVFVFLIGRLYSAGWLLPHTSNKVMNNTFWVVNNIIIYSPIFLFMLLRKQGLETIFISNKCLVRKLSLGIVASLLGVVLFSGIRDEWHHIPQILSASVESKALINFPAVFFENVALAFLFVRLKWAVGIKWAIGVPSILFAFAHVPGSLAEGDPWNHIIIFFFLTGSLTTIILYTAYRSRDIIWLGVVHFVMDVVIKAF